MRALFLLAACAAPVLSGCGGRDVLDTPVNWWHGMEGGAIAEQRPPPPGVNDPYPHVGTVPARAPQVASLDLRRSVTTGLVRQRGLTNRLDANDPLPSPQRPPPPPRPPASAGQSSATLDAAQGAAHPAVAASADSEPELALPAVQLQPASGAPVAVPEIPGAPPAPPRLPGLALRAGLPAAPPAPDYATAAPAGTAIAFAPGTDTILHGQEGLLHALAARRGAGSVRVQGFGDAEAADPPAQAQALSLASLRARAVASALQSEGVPPGAILLRADAFGRGAAVSLVQ